ncbi:hypothetical protein NEOLEDRAFT_1106062 [Neolentinus lepideus HHB14362 ss-1]|uniref:Secreted protein n=1 Tax=Neolentinus lepideus HHB14362 ss-1 TaxID=1314782 RepID=A0A165VG71_9AGAM|nr:hypothetical protein NEOLEDRAFT_1106062 [Neolentinus lepideus HHB14362 ss-1]
MIFKSVLALASLAASAMAQSIDIGAPTNGSTISVGTNITVEVDRPDTLTGSQEIAIVIAIRSCYGGVCIDPADALGSVLYTGPFDPQFTSEPGTASKPPHQNFSVAIPGTLQTGLATLSVTHFSLVGASPFPLFEIRNITVNVD